MKRLILAAVLLFPVITLVAWFYWGATQPRLAPGVLPVTTNTLTNGIVPEPSK
jgi:hypothetical protein